MQAFPGLATRASAPIPTRYSASDAKFHLLQSAPRRLSVTRSRLQFQTNSQSLSTGTVIRLPGSEQEIKWGSSLSRATNLSDAMDEAIAGIRKSVGQDALPDLAMVFASSVHGEEFEQVVPLLREKIPSLRTIFGCSGFGIVGGSEDGPLEVEGEHAFSLTLGQLPGATVRVLHTLRSSIPDGNASPEDWAQFVGVAHECAQPTSFLVFADPRFVQVRDLIAGLDYAFPDAHKIGSILSSGTRSKSRAMWAWSASGPANVAAGSVVGAVSRRLGRSGSNPLRGGRRSRVADGLSSAMSTKDMAAAVMAVMGQDLGTQQPQPQGQQQQDDGVRVDPSKGTSSSVGELPPDVVLLSGQQGDSSTGDESDSGENSKADSQGKRPGLLGSLGSLFSSIGNKAGPRGGGASSDSSAIATKDDSQGPATRGVANASASAQTMLQAMKDSLLSPLTGDSDRRGSGGLSSTSQLLAPDVPCNGMYLYGAIVLAIQGQVQLDVITSMGYRAPSPRIWRIESLSGNDHIVTLVPEELAAEAAQGGRSPQSTGASGRGRVVSRDDDSDDESDDDDDDGSGPEVQALAAVVDMLDALTENQSEMMEVLDDWDELLDTAVVAIAADNSKPASELGPEDWELLPLQEIVEEYGVLVVGDPPVVGGGVDLRRGNRIQLLVRDPRGVREDLRNALLAYKRRDLASMMAGQALPPTFGALLLTDVDRGMDCYDTPNYESGMAHSYVPTPISGVFGGAQIAPLQSSARATAILEYSAVVGVLRATSKDQGLAPLASHDGTSAL